MKNATKAIIERDLTSFIRTLENERYILEDDVTVITYQILRNYSNVYCHSETNKLGRKVYSINSARTHKPFIEVYVRETPVENYRK